MSNGGSLERLVECQGGRISEALAQEITRQICNGLACLHEKNILHRDLKLENILINFPERYQESQVSDEFLEEFDINNEGIEVIIGDLGLAKRLEKNVLADTLCGTPLNMAPEVFFRDYYDSSADIWSLGTIIYEMLVGDSPFISQTYHELQLRLNNGQYKIPRSLNLSVECIDLIHS